jgi:thioredoxin-related protein
VCHSCETLKTQIEFQNQLIRELTKPQVAVEEIENKDYKPISAKHKPWSVVRAELEKKDRELSSRLVHEKEVTVENLDAVISGKV